MYFLFFLQNCIDVQKNTYLLYFSFNNILQQENQSFILYIYIYIYIYVYIYKITD